MYRVGKWELDEEEEMVYMLHMVVTLKRVDLNNMLLDVQCETIARRLSHLSGKVICVTAVKKNLTITRQRFNKFMEFLSLPGVNYKAETNTVTITTALYPFVNENQPKCNNIHGLPNYAKLYQIFTVNGVARLPDEELGTHSNPIDLEDGLHNVEHDIDDPEAEVNISNGEQPQ